MKLFRSHWDKEREDSKTVIYRHLADGYRQYFVDDLIRGWQQVDGSWAADQVARGRARFVDDWLADE